MGTRLEFLWRCDCPCESMHSNNLTLATDCFFFFFFNGTVIKFTTIYHISIPKDVTSLLHWSSCSPNSHSKAASRASLIMHHLWSAPSLRPAPGCTLSPAAHFNRKYSLRGDVNVILTYSSQATVARTWLFTHTPHHATPCHRLMWTVRVSRKRTVTHRLSHRRQSSSAEVVSRSRDSDSTSV